MESNDPAFWQACDALVDSSAITIDRPRGTPHPQGPELIYPLDYGYLVGTTGGDGAAIDVWLGSGASKTVTAVACTVDLFKRDAELKLLLSCNEDEIAKASRFLNDMARLPCLILKRSWPLEGRAGTATRPKA